MILGPPNHHDYQNQLRKLHAERFARMPFEAFKARVKIVKDEAVVKKWIEDQSFKTEYNCLNVPEALKLPNREEVEKHFRQVHLGNIVKPVESHTLSGPAARQLRSPGVATPGAHDLGGATAFSLEGRHHFEPAVCRSRPAILQSQPHGNACFRRASAFPRSRSNACFGGRQAHRQLHQYASKMHTAQTHRDAGARARCHAPAAPADRDQGQKGRKGRQRRLPLRRRRLKRRRSRRRWRAICTGSFTRGMSLNLPTASWTRPKDRCQNRPSPRRKPRPPQFPAKHQPHPPRRPHPMKIPLRQLRLIPPRPFPQRKRRPASPPMENKC